MKVTAEELFEIYRESLEVEDFSSLLENLSIINREITIGEVDETSSTSVDMLIRYWNMVDADLPTNERQPIKIFIDSPGGNVQDGLAIIDAIQLSKTPVHTIVTKEAISMGLIISISGHCRYCYPNAVFMFHEGSCDGSLNLSANKFRNFASYYTKILQRTRKILLENTSLDEDWYERYKNDDVWFFPEEALAFGVVDEILEELV